MNHLTISIGLFILFFILLQLFKPSIMYQPDGTLRQFGIGYRKKTVVPLWLGVILLAILSFSLSLFIQ